MKKLVIDSERLRSGKQTRYWCRMCHLDFLSESKRNTHAYEIHIAKVVK